MPPKRSVEPINTFGLRSDYYLFAQLCISIWVSICNGAVFIFGLMSPYLKEEPFNFDQRSVALVSTTGAVLGYISLPTGYLFDNFGPKPTLMMGGLFSVAGWASLYFIFAYNLTTSVWALAAAYGVAQLSASFYETGSLLTNLESFRCQQGKIVILQKTFMGLGGSLIATYYAGFFSDNLPGFFLFLTMFNLFWAFLGAFTIHLPGPGLWARGLNTGISAEADGPRDETSHLDPHAGRNPKPQGFRHDVLAERSYDKAFRIGFVCLGLTIVLLTGAALATTFKHIGKTGETLVGIAALLMPFTFWLMIPSLPKTLPSREDSEAAAVASEAELAKKQAGKAATNGDAEEGSRTESMATVDGGAAAAAEADEKPTISYVPPGFTLNSNGLLTNMKTLELWLVWFVCLCVWGAGTVIAANGAQIYKALDNDGYTKQENDVYVSIYGVASACGRVIVGFMHPWLLGKGYHISVLFPVAPIMMAVAMPLYIIMPPGALLLTFAATGLAQGFSWGTTVLLMKGLFSPNNVGKHYAMLYTAGMLTPIVFSVWMFAGVYDHYSEMQGRTATHDCVGTVCIASPLLVLMGLNLAAFCAAFVFYLRIKTRKGLVAAC